MADRPQRTLRKRSQSLQREGQNVKRLKQSEINYRLRSKTTQGGSNTRSRTHSSVTAKSSKKSHTVTNKIQTRRHLLRRKEPDKERRDSTNLKRRRKAATVHQLCRDNKNKLGHVAPNSTDRKSSKTIYPQASRISGTVQNSEFGTSQQGQGNDRSTRTIVIPNSQQTPESGKPEVKVKKNKSLEMIVKQLHAKHMQSSPEESTVEKGSEAERNLGGQNTNTGVAETDIVLNQDKIKLQIKERPSNQQLNTEKVADKLSQSNIAVQSKQKSQDESEKVMKHSKVKGGGVNGSDMNTNIKSKEPSLASATSTVKDNATKLKSKEPSLASATSTVKDNATNRKRQVGPKKTCGKKIIEIKVEDLTAADYDVMEGKRRKRQTSEANKNGVKRRRRQDGSPKVPPAGRKQPKGKQNKKGTNVSNTTEVKKNRKQNLKPKTTAVGENTMKGKKKKKDIRETKKKKVIKRNPLSKTITESRNVKETKPKFIVIPNDMINKGLIKIVKLKSSQQDIKLIQGQSSCKGKKKIVVIRRQQRNGSQDKGVKTNEGLCGDIASVNQHPDAGKESKEKDGSELVASQHSNSGNNSKEKGGSELVADSKEKGGSELVASQHSNTDNKSKEKDGSELVTNQHPDAGSESIEKDGSELAAKQNPDADNSQLIHKESHQGDERVHVQDNTMSSEAVDTEKESEEEMTKEIKKEITQPVLDEQLDIESTELRMREDSQASDHLEMSKTNETTDKSRHMIVKKMYPPNSHEKDIEQQHFKAELHHDGNDNNETLENALHTKKAVEIVRPDIQDISNEDKSHQSKGLIETSENEACVDEKVQPETTHASADVSITSNDTADESRESHEAQQIQEENSWWQLANQHLESLLNQGSTSGNRKKTSPKFLIIPRSMVNKSQIKIIKLKQPQKDFMALNIQEHSQFEVEDERLRNIENDRISDNIQDNEQSASNSDEVMNEGEVASFVKSEQTEDESEYHVVVQSDTSLIVQQNLTPDDENIEESELHHCSEDADQSLTSNPEVPVEHEKLKPSSQTTDCSAKKTLTSLVIAPHILNKLRGVATIVKSKTELQSHVQSLSDQGSLEEKSERIDPKPAQKSGANEEEYSEQHEEGCDQSQNIELLTTQKGDVENKSGTVIAYIHGSQLEQQDRKEQVSMVRELDIDTESDTTKNREGLHLSMSPYPKDVVQDKTDNTHLDDKLLESVEEQRHSDIRKKTETEYLIIPREMIQKGIIKIIKPNTKQQLSKSEQHQMQVDELQTSLPKCDSNLTQVDDHQTNLTWSCQSQIQVGEHSTSLPKSGANQTQVDEHQTNLSMKKGKRINDIILRMQQNEASTLRRKQSETEGNETTNDVEVHKSIKKEILTEINEKVTEELDCNQDTGPSMADSQYHDLQQQIEDNEKIRDMEQHVTESIHGDQNRDEKDDETEDRVGVLKSKQTICEEEQIGTEGNQDLEQPKLIKTEVVEDFSSDEHKVVEEESIVNSTCIQNTQVQKEMLDDRTTENGEDQAKTEPEVEMKKGNMQNSEENTMDDSICQQDVEQNVQNLSKQNQDEILAEMEERESCQKTADVIETMEEQGQTVDGNEHIKSSELLRSDESKLEENSDLVQSCDSQLLKNSGFQQRDIDQPCLQQNDNNECSTDTLQTQASSIPNSKSEDCCKTNKDLCNEGQTQMELSDTPQRREEMEPSNAPRKQEEMEPSNAPKRQEEMEPSNTPKRQEDNNCPMREEERTPSNSQGNHNDEENQVLNTCKDTTADENTANKETINTTSESVMAAKKRKRKTQPKSIIDPCIPKTNVEQEINEHKKYIKLRKPNVAIKIECRDQQKIVQVDLLKEANKEIAVNKSSERDGGTGKDTGITCSTERERKTGENSSVKSSQKGEFETKKEASVKSSPKGESDTNQDASVKSSPKGESDATKDTPKSPTYIIVPRSLVREGAIKIIKMKPIKSLRRVHLSPKEEQNDSQEPESKSPNKRTECQTEEHGSPRSRSKRRKCHP